jgi:MFS family permease
VCGTLISPLAGFLLDRYGRKLNGTCSVLGLAGGFAVLWLRGIDFEWFVGGCLIIGVGDGFSSGLLMSLGGDAVSKVKEPGPFLGLYKLLNEIGSILGPLIAGLVVQFADARIAAATFMGVGLLAATWMLLLVTESAPNRQKEKTKDTAVRSVPTTASPADEEQADTAVLEEVFLVQAEVVDGDRRASG